jgi:hypothetical protein
MESIERLEARGRAIRTSQRVGEPSAPESSVAAVRIVKLVSLDPAYGCVDWFEYEPGESRGIRPVVGAA